MHISQSFDGGNIEVVSCADPADIRLEIRPDRGSAFYQWFYFRLAGARGIACTMRILNAGGAAYPDGFRDYRVLYSYDRRDWLRSGTRFRDGELSFDFTPERDAVHFAYFTPYPMERHHELVARAQAADHVGHRVLGRTLDGQDLDLLRFAGGGPGERRPCWIIARQHPGETMAEWWMEGCIERLLDARDAVTRSLLGRCDLYLVPNMNPDGSRRGHLRTNAAGRNLNREWEAPSMEHSPEVFLAREAMDETGVGFLLDVHGDEALPYCFIAGTEGLADWSGRDQRRLDFYRDRLARINPDFQTEKGYPPKPRGQANMTMSAARAAARHGCLAMTLEMPFKDAAATPDPRRGWSAARSGALARSCLEALDDALREGAL